MNKIFALIQIPLVKIIAIIAILYFGLFSNKDNPNSLRNRFSQDRIEQNIKEAKDRSLLITSSVKTAQEIAQQKKSNPALNEIISKEDLEIGSGDHQASCGDEVEISYAIYDNKNSQIKSVNFEKLIIGSNLNEIIEKNIYGMKQGGVRIINIPHDYKTNNAPIKQLLTSYDSQIKYQISLNKINHLNKQQNLCQ